MKTFIASVLFLSGILNAEGQNITFSHAHGFYNKTFNLSLSLDNNELTENQSIRYTTDGSVPTLESALYSNSLKISHNTILRAALFDTDTIASPIATATYLFEKDILEQGNSPEGYPDTWGPYCDIDGIATADYEMDPKMTSDQQLRSKITDGLTAIPTLSIVTDKDHFFNQEIDEETGGIYIYTGAPTGPGTGRNWERPISMELFGGTQEHDLTVDCGIKIHGGHSRLPEKTPKHSLRLMFKSKYGPSKLKYRLFGEEGPKKFDQLILRCAFGNTWQHWDSTNRKRAQYARDMWARNIQRLMGQPSSRGLYVHVYLNGMYWGLYNIAERIDDYYCSSNFGGEREDYDVIKVEEYKSGHTIEAGDGDLTTWNQMVEMAEKAATSHAAFAKIQGLTTKGEKSETDVPLLDVNNFIDFMLINQYGGNTDWDHHNWLAFRNRTNPETGFRFICWDSELIFGDVNQNVLNTVNNGAPTYILSQLMQNVGFKHQYLDRAYQLLVKRGGLLTPEKVEEVWDSLYHIIELPLYDEAARWGDYRRDVHPYNSRGDLYTVDGRFMTERNRLKTKYFPVRTQTLLNQITAKEWTFEASIPKIKINGVEDEDTDTISFGDVLTLKQDGIGYFTIDGSAPVTWLSTNTGKIGKTTTRYSGKNLLANYDWSQGPNVTVRAITRGTNDWSITMERTFYVKDIPDGIGDLIATSPTSSVGIFDLSGRHLPDNSTLPRGIYIINGKKVMVK